MRASASELAGWRRAAWARWPSLPAMEFPLDGPAGTAHGAEVVLVCAVLAGVRQALEVLELEYLEPLLRSLSQRWERDVVDDALQAMRERLLVGGSPALREWPARDRLERWLRVCAVREVMSARRERPQLTPEPAIMSAGGDLSHRHREALEHALKTAVEQLEPAQRGILKLHLLENVSVESIAALHGVSRATMTRWLAAARDSLAEGLRAEGRERLDVGDRTLDSLARPLLDQLEVSLAGLLRGSS